MDDIHLAILTEESPFKDQIVNDPWSSPVDVHQLSDSLFKLVMQLGERVEKAVDGQSHIIAIGGDAGEGKTHFLSRMRKKSEDLTYCFVYLHTPVSLEHIFRHFFRSFIESLLRKDPKSEFSILERMCREAMTNELIKTLEEDPDRRSKLISRFSWHRYRKIHCLLADLKNPKKFTQIIKKFKSNHLLELLCEQLAFRLPKTSPDVIRALLALGIPEYRLAALKYLRGDSLLEREFESLGVELVDLDEDRAFERLITLISFANRPIYVCFDEFETLMKQFPEKGADCLLGAIRRLYHASSRLILVLMLVTGTWNENIANQHKSFVDRLYGQKLHHLDSLSEETLLELVKKRMGVIWSKKNLVPPLDTFPFERTFLSRLGKEANWNVRRIVQSLHRVIEHLKDSRKITIISNSFDVSSLLAKEWPAIDEIFEDEIKSSELQLERASHEEIQDVIFQMLLQLSQKGMSKHIVHSKRCIAGKNQYIELKLNAGHIVATVHIHICFLRQRMRFQARTAEKSYASPNNLFAIFIRLRGEKGTPQYKDIVEELTKTERTSEIVVDQYTLSRIWALSSLLKKIASGDYSDLSRFSQQSVFDYFFSNIIPLSPNLDFLQKKLDETAVFPHFEWKDLIGLIEDGEREIVDFKEDKPGDIAKILSCFSNSRRGGFILIGVNDSGETVGVKKPKNLITSIKRTSRSMNPSPQFRCQVIRKESSDVRVIVVKIPHSKRRIGTKDNTYYHRVDDDCLHLPHPNQSERK